MHVYACICTKNNTLRTHLRNAYICDYHVPVVHTITEVSWEHVLS